MAKQPYRRHKTHRHKTSSNKTNSHKTNRRKTSGHKTHYKTNPKNHHKTHQIHSKKDPGKILLQNPNQKIPQPTPPT